MRRSSLPVTRKKSDPGRLPATFKVAKSSKGSKSPSLPKRLSPPDGSTSLSAGTGVSGTSGGAGSISGTSAGAVSGAVKVRTPSGGSGGLHPPHSSSGEDTHYSTEDLDTMSQLETVSRENGGSSDGILDDLDGQQATDADRTRAAIGHIQSKIVKTKEQIRTEQANKEAIVNEYLRLAASADKQQLQRIKQVFEKKNQKSAQTINQLQKKLETYNKRVKDVELHGPPSHKQAKEVLKDVSQGLNSIVSKPREFAHLIKNKFGSADNINQLKILEECQTSTDEERPHGGHTLPASFKYGSDDDNSSITSGSGFGAHSSPHSASHNVSQQLPVLPHINLEPLLHELQEQKEAIRLLHESNQRLHEELESFKVQNQSDIGHLRTMFDDERYRFGSLEDQINDLTELHQNEVTNLRQDVSSMEEKIEYQLEERTRDMHDILENCQTRITKMELQQQQQQIISMEIVENVTFRTLLTKLINVVLALVAVILVFVSTAANLLTPFLQTRARILSTSIMVFCLIMLLRNWDNITQVGVHIRDSYTALFTSDS